MSVPMKRLPDNSWPDVVQPGEFFYVTELDDSGERTGKPKRIVFGCTCPNGQCSVPFAPMRNPNNATWKWDGNLEQPTLAPSIDCVGRWHGFIRAGQIVDA